MAYITPESSAHWYSQKGKPQHDATLREARKENLLPSVTTVFNILYKPMLESWKQEQVILAALTMPDMYKKDKDLDEIAKQIAKDSKEPGKMAAKKGIKVHKCIEKYIKNDEMSLDKEDSDFNQLLHVAYNWIDNHINSGVVEDRRVNLELGYAGTLDFYGSLKDGRIAVIDFKTKTTQKDKKVFIPDDYCWQLAAYANSFTVSNNQYPVCMNVMFSTTEVGRIEVREWKNEELVHGFEIFRTCLKLWRQLRKYPFIKEV